MSSIFHSFTFNIVCLELPTVCVEFHITATGVNEKRVISQTFSQRL